PGNEIRAARYIRDVLQQDGIASEIVGPSTDRGTIVARLKGDGSAPPLLLMSHTDVVAVEPEKWTHDPFAADIADGFVYGRGALDMKNLVAMQLEVMRLLAEEARAAGRDPATDPVPGLRRDVLFASTADEEAGGLAGAGWLATEH